MKSIPVDSLVNLLAQTFRALRVARALALGLCGLAINTFGASITFSHTGVGSGSIGSIEFSERAFTLTAVGDTSTRVTLNPNAFGYAIDHVSAAITISGVGNFTLVSPTRTFVNNEYSLVGLARAGATQSDLFNGPTNPSLGSWNMLSSIGPVNGSGFLLQWDNFPLVMTDGGILNFQSGSTVVTFQAVVVPEPGCAALLIIGVGAGVRFRRRLTFS